MLRLYKKSSPDPKRFLHSKESLSYQVTKVLLAEGLRVSDYNGTPLKHTKNMTYVGVLRKRHRGYLKYLFFRPTITNEYDQVGIISFQDLQLGATNQKWVFEVHGARNLTKAHTIASLLKDTFGVEIRLRLLF